MESTTGILMYLGCFHAHALLRHDALVVPPAATSTSISISTSIARSTSTSSNSSVSRTAAASIAPAAAPEDLLVHLLILRPLLPRRERLACCWELGRLPHPFLDLELLGFRACDVAHLR